MARRSSRDISPLYFSLRRSVVLERFNGYISSTYKVHDRITSEMKIITIPDTFLNFICRNDYVLDMLCSKISIFWNLEFIGKKALDKCFQYDQSFHENWYTTLLRYSKIYQRLPLFVILEYCEFTLQESSSVFHIIGTNSTEMRWLDTREL